jgi:hypothetical protein
LEKWKGWLKNGTLAKKMNKFPFLKLPNEFFLHSIMLLENTLRFFHPVYLPTYLMKRESDRLRNIYAGPIVGKTFMKGGQGWPCKLLSAERATGPLCSEEEQQTMMKISRRSLRRTKQ